MLRMKRVLPNAALRSANRPWASTMLLALVTLMGLPLSSLPLCTCETPSHRTQTSAWWGGGAGSFPASLWGYLLLVCERGPYPTGWL